MSIMEYVFTTFLIFVAAYLLGYFVGFKEGEK
jgi:hypothetical protein